MDTALPGDDVDVTWEQARAANLANWNDRVPLHAEAYGTEVFDTDPHHLSQVVTTDLRALAKYLPDGVRGLDVCHLQCHIGTDTVSLARAGARVTGVDFSVPALVRAQGLAERVGIEAHWVEADVLEARAAVSRHLGTDTAYDLVYTSIGTIGWLKDLDQWARQIYALLRPGGWFYIRDGHPAMHCLDETREELVTKYRYFANGKAQLWEEEGTYVGDGKVANPRTLEYPHPHAEVLNALIDAGLTIRGFDEGDTLPWRFMDTMVELPDGDFALPEHQRALMPLTFTVVARKPV